MKDTKRKERISPENLALLHSANAEMEKAEAVRNFAMAFVAQAEGLNAREHRLDVLTGEIKYISDEAKPE